ncbi:rab11 family-interacting protein 4B-like isoform X2 [Panonychus citri]|uniref:rab11 family-interacting protein 4B-like isoform X2 n=1 Tax=Panonychus citri TaxID=50023 RepID=UPI002307385F|nr:rab11 family-interacting protein 4B-like isoform X2 [Panonychus citri]
MGPNNVSLERNDSSKSERIFTNNSLDQTSSSQPSSPSSGYLSYHCDDLVNDPNSLEDSIFHQLNEKIDLLQHQITILEENQSLNDEKYRRVKQDNNSLLNKIHALEDQIRDLEVQGEEWRREEEKMLKTAIARSDREKSDQCDELKSQIYSLQHELLEVRSETHKHSNLVDKLKEEKRSLRETIKCKDDEIEELRNDLTKIREMNKRLKDDERVNIKMIQVLSMELEDLRCQQLPNLHQLSSSQSSPSYSSPLAASSPLSHNHQSNQQLAANDSTNNRRKLSSSSITSETKEVKLFLEFKEEVKKLKEENRNLREANEELEAQILANHLEEGRSLLREEEAASSLAEELNNLSLEPLRVALREQKECNKKLRAYIDGILLNIVENYPQLLEVKKK